MSVEAELAALRAEVRRLSDTEAVKKLTAEYMQAMHDARWDDALACFSDRAQYDHGLLGNLADKSAIRHFYTEHMPKFDEAGGWAFDMLTNPVISVDGDTAEGRWFLFTLLIDPDSKEAAWNIATLEYIYTREADGWKFLRNRCITEHQSVPYATGWGKSGKSRVSSLTKAEAVESPMNFDLVNAQGGKQKPGRLSRSIQGWTVPTLDPEG